ncbi:glutathione ABC transporter substrate-binding protein [Bacillus sp. H-16]|uniref:glutathione ABC transporter substrate-binding protein n=1 Tax=Alteribacter salitolerans TaxID=2912333 RepID=UPI00196382D9|nr:glutathione ABC transporter substrate-binding protein [Alteribacter salitolerans]MBM7096727.1 glutathione ABC transporter substrate-binding protein [Alteribacter salitolerans]
MKKGFLSLLFLTAIAVGTACASDDAGELGSETNNGENTESADNANDLTIGVPSDAQTLDPQGGNEHATLNVGRTIYDTLVFTDGSMDMHMRLAESFEQIEDTTWEVELREDVQFHDGSDFNAEAVKVNIERLLDPDVASPVSFMFDMITDVEVVDDYTVHIHTDIPFAPLRAHFAHPGGHMIAPSAIEADYEAMEDGAEPGSYINQNPIGTGAFTLEEWNPGEFVKVTKNEDYWGDVANVDSITFKVVPEDNTRVAELETNSSQMISHLNPDFMSRVEGNDDLKIATQESVSLFYLGFNVEQEPFDDPQVRTAISKAVDKEAIIDGLLNGAGLPAKGPLAPPVFGSSDDIKAIEKDLEEARELLADAGYPDGFEATLTVETSQIGSDVAENIQAQLEEIGIDLDIETLERGAYVDVVTNARQDMFLGSWGTVTGDADYGLYPMFHSSNHGIAGNRTFYANEEVDALLEEARSGTEEERLALYHDAQQLIVDDAPMVPLYHTEHMAGLQDNIEDFYIHPSSFFYLGDVNVQ